MPHNAVRRASNLLKTLALLGIILLMLGQTALRVIYWIPQYPTRDMPYWLLLTRAILDIGGTALQGLIISAIAYGAAVALDFLLVIEGNTRALGSMIRRQRQPAPSDQFEFEPIHAPRPQHLWTDRGESSERYVANSPRDGRQVKTYYYAPTGQRVFRKGRNPESR